MLFQFSHPGAHGEGMLDMLPAWDESALPAPRPIVAGLVFSPFPTSVTHRRHHGAWLQKELFCNPEAVGDTERHPPWLYK